MMQKEKKLMVAQLKGLLMGLENEVGRARFNLAGDNIENLGNEIDSFKAYIDAMDKILLAYTENIETEDGDLF